ncbi:recombination directionality factor [Paraburkholderia fungorum]|uniref:Uncharacterized protein n=1 Tax=Paraburkholderia fungorum TaxID=134537 RepID=A0AAW3UZR2_9BURK|nr:hypothetical protein [Paraburkholderia fungorum]MBB4518669.1 hypothetical protein [Paraburkholderia fungorum]MBB6204154.1 hypothetical protein [Paraburkholderia fungorum]
MVTGLEFDTPILGTVRMGDARPGEAGAQDELVHFDYFEVHTRRKNADGTWAKHALHEKLLNGQEGAGQGDGEHEPKKLREIPILLPYNNPDLLLTQQFEARRLSDGRRVCVGDGNKAIRIVDANRTGETTCPGCDRCPFGNSPDVFCQRRTSFVFRIDGQGDQFSVFVLHSAGKNTGQTLVAKLHAMYGAFGGKLVGIPMSLKMRNTASVDAVQGPVFYADLVLRGVNPIEAVKMAREHEKEQLEAGFDQQGLEAAMLELKKHSRFAPPEEFGQVRDFYAKDARRSSQEVVSQHFDGAAVNSCENLVEGRAEGGVLESDGACARWSTVGPAAGARERMRAAAAAAGREGATSPATADEAPQDVKVSEERPKTLQLVQPAPQHVATAPSAAPPVGAAIPRVVATALSGIPEMPRANAVPAAF